MLIAVTSSPDFLKRKSEHNPMELLGRSNCIMFEVNIIQILEQWSFYVWGDCPFIFNLSVSMPTLFISASICGKDS